DDHRRRPELPVDQHPVAAHDHWTLAPCAIHWPMTTRSSSGMPVLLPKGMVLFCTTRFSMRGTIAWICEVVSNMMPRGATTKLVSVGLFEWQARQRRSMMLRTSAKLTDRLATASGARRTVK